MAWPSTTVTIEVHSRLAPLSATEPSSTQPIKAPPPRIALTFDACSGRFDADLVALLIKHRIPATLFVTGVWIAANPQGVAVLKANLDLFSIQNHGARHIPAIVGPGQRVYGLLGHADLAGLRREVLDGADAIVRTFGTRPTWYRGATAVYDRQALDEIARLGFGVAGFSINDDAGAKGSRRSVAEHLRRARDGDVVLAHMNHPEGQTAEGMADVLEQLVQQGTRFVRLDQASLVEVPQGGRSGASARDSGVAPGR